MSNDKDYEIDKIEGTSQDIDETELTIEMRLLYTLGKIFMDQTGVGFLMLSSPNTKKTPNGFEVPTATAIVINESAGFTRSMVAELLKDFYKELDPTHPIDEFLSEVGLLDE
jgi:hypothetical protein